MENRKNHELTTEETKELKNLFDYHKPDGAQKERYEAIRDAGLEFAKVIYRNTIESSDRKAAVRRVRHAVSDAHMAIATSESEIGREQAKTRGEKRELAHSNN